MTCRCNDTHGQKSFDFWFRTLIDAGVLHEYRRVKGLANLILKNDFDSLAQLRKASHPRDWWGASFFDEAELDAVWRLCQARCACARRALCELWPEL